MHNTKKSIFQIAIVNHFFLFNNIHNAPELCFAYFVFTLLICFYSISKKNMLKQSLIIDNGFNFEKLSEKSSFDLINKIRTLISL